MGRLDPPSRARLRRVKEQPKPLLRHFEWYRPSSWSQLTFRPLSLSFEAGSNIQSPLLALPAELRNLTYTVALGNSIVPLISVPLFAETREKVSGQKIIPRTRVTQARCRPVGGLYCECFGWHTVFEGSHYEQEAWGYDPDRASTERIGLGLLQTCR